MNIKNYLEITGDKIIKNISESTVETTFGNTFIFNLEGEIEKAKWVIPITGEIRELKKEELNNLSKYFLQSYGERCMLYGKS